MAHSTLLESGGPEALSQSTMGPPEPPRRYTDGGVVQDHAQLYTGTEEQLQNPPQSSHKPWAWPKGLSSQSEFRPEVIQFSGMAGP